MKCLLLIITICFSSAKILFSYDSTTSFQNDWQNWQSEWENSVKVNGSEIHVSKRIDQTIGQPFAMPNANSLMPEFGPYGINWQAGLTINSIGDVFQSYYNHLSWIFSPDNADIMLSAALAALMEYYHCDQALNQIEQYMQVAQGYDNLTTSIQNHRYELAKWVLENHNTEQDTNSGWNFNIFVSPAENNLQNWESHVNEAIKGKITQNYSDDATAFINLMMTNGTNIFSERYSGETLSSRYSILSNLKVIYQASLDANFNVITKGGVESVMHDTMSLFEEYCYDRAMGKDPGTQINRFYNTYYNPIKYYGIDDRIEKWRNNWAGHGSELDEITRVFMFGVYHDLIISTISQIEGLSGIMMQKEDQELSLRLSNELRKALEDYHIYQPNK
jgi:hypothetical protein